MSKKTIPNALEKYIVLNLEGKFSHSAMKPLICGSDAQS